MLHVSVVTYYFQHIVWIIHIHTLISHLKVYLMLRFLDSSGWFFFFSLYRMLINVPFILPGFFVILRRSSIKVGQTLLPVQRISMIHILDITTHWSLKPSIKWNTAQIRRNFNCNHDVQCYFKIQFKKFSTTKFVHHFHMILTRHTTTGNVYTEWHCSEVEVTFLLTLIYNYQIVIRDYCYLLYLPDTPG